jgi:hypothetical protein
MAAAPSLEQQSANQISLQATNHLLFWRLQVTCCMQCEQLCASPAAILDIIVVAPAGCLHAFVQAGAYEGLAQCKGHLGIAIEVTVCAAIANHITLQ